MAHPLRDDDDGFSRAPLSRVAPHQTPGERYRALLGRHLPQRTYGCAGSRGACVWIVWYDAPAQQVHYAHVHNPRTPRDPAARCDHVGTIDLWQYISEFGREDRKAIEIFAKGRHA